jgi:Rv2632c-like
MPEQSWSVNVSFTEDADRTRADAVLELASQKFHGFGQAKRAPEDPSVPVIGQDLAAARALSDLSHQLLEAAAERIESFEGHPVKLHG